MEEKESVGTILFEMNFVQEATFVASNIGHGCKHWCNGSYFHNNMNICCEILLLNIKAMQFRKDRESGLSDCLL